VKCEVYFSGVVIFFTCLDLEKNPYLWKDTNDHVSEPMRIKYIIRTLYELYGVIKVYGKNGQIYDQS
jgi:hypothetical protein